MKPDISLVVNRIWLKLTEVGRYFSCFERYNSPFDLLPVNFDFHVSHFSLMSIADKSNFFNFRVLFLDFKKSTRWENQLHHSTVNPNHFPSVRCQGKSSFHSRKSRSRFLNLIELIPFNRLFFLEM